MEHSAESVAHARKERKAIARAARYDTALSDSAAVGVPSNPLCHVQAV